MCVLYAISIYTSYTEFTHYSTTVDCWSSWTSALKHVRCVCLVQKRRLQDVCATVLWHCQSAADQSCPIYCYDFYKKSHSYVTAQRTFNWFCQNRITISWHIHLQIYAESLVKFGQKVTDIGPYGKTNVSLSLFFWTQCVSDSFLWLELWTLHGNSQLVYVCACKFVIKKQMM